MSDLPLEGRVVEEKKEVPLTLEQRVDQMARDIQELARGINAQAKLLGAVVLASDRIVNTYTELMNIPKVGGAPDEKKEEPKITAS